MNDILKYKNIVKNNQNLFNKLVFLIYDKKNELEKLEDFKELSTLIVSVNEDLKKIMEILSNM